MDMEDMDMSDRCFTAYAEGRRHGRRLGPGKTLAMAFFFPPRPPLKKIVTGQCCGCACGCGMNDRMMTVHGGHHNEYECPSTTTTWPGGATAMVGYSALAVCVCGAVRGQLKGRIRSVGVG
jgi:hypothetical protein